MSTTIDQRVVEMRFDNKQFESNVAETMSTLSKFKQSLKLEDASKGLENVGAAAKGINLSGLSSAAETVGLKFNAMYTIADQALRNITNSAVNAGKKIVSALTIDPIKTGLSEYETQINAVQTILANTESKGSTLDDVTAALDELNTYADKTIYNFTEMTRNIGTFTAAGVDLDTSVTAIKGIANLAAVSGSNSQQASTAMYQLSQALSSGTVKLMDWNSVVNAGMGGQVFQDAIKETARVHGVEIDKMIAEQGSFRETLSSGWLSADILLETLEKFTMTTEGLTAAEIDANRAKLRNLGYTDDQIDAIFKLGNTATNAATKVKTMTQLWDTLQETAQSGWTQTWELIFGDFEDAKTLFSDLYNLLAPIIEASSNARNELLQGWKDAGGRDDLIASLYNVFEGISSIVKPIKEAFREIFPPITVKHLTAFTAGLKNLTEKMTLGEKTSNNLKRTFKGLFAVLDIVKQVFSGIFKAISPLFGSVDDLGGGVLGLTAVIGDGLVKFNEVIKTGGIFEKSAQRIATAIEFIISNAKKAISAIKKFAARITKDIEFPDFSGFHDFLEKIGEKMEGIGEAAGSMKSLAVRAIEGIGAAFSSCNFFKLLETLWNGIKTLGSGIAKSFGSIARGFGNAFGGLDFERVFNFINSLIAGGVGIGLIKFFKSFRGGVDSIAESAGGILESFSDIGSGIVDTFDSVRGCFEAYQTQLKAGALLKIAGAIAILVGALVVAAMIDPEKLGSAIGAITMLFADLMGSMALIDKLGGGFKGITTLSTAMVGISIAVLILASALKKISDLDAGEMTAGLLGVVGLMGAMVGAAKILGRGGGTIVKGATQMIIFAAAVKILASVCMDLSSLSWGELVKGLIGVVGLMGSMALFLKTADFGGKTFSTATGMVVMAAAVKILASACNDLGSMSVGELTKGLVAVAIVLAEIAGFTKLIGKPERIVSTGVAMIALGAAMKIFASVIQSLGSMSVGGLAKGLVSMALALTMVVGAVRLLPKNMVSTGIGLLAVSTALTILSSALTGMGGMSWEEVGKSLVTLCASIMTLALALRVMKGTVSGSAAMVIAVGALAALTPVLTVLGAMSWKSIGKGLLTIAGAFTVIGLAGLLLTPLVPTILGLAGAFALIGAGVLVIGVGLLAAGTGLSALAVGVTAFAGAIAGSATAIVAGLTVIIGGIVGLIPVIVEQFGAAIVAFCGVIADGAPAIGEAVKALVLCIIDVLVECVPAIAEGALQLIVGIMNALVAYTPQIVDSLFQFVVGIINGLAKNLPDLIKAVVNVFMSLFSGVADALGNVDIDTLLKGGIGVGLMAGLMVALSSVAALTPGAMLGVLGMGAVIAELAIVLAAIGALAQIPGLDWLITEGGYLLESIGTAIGQFVGGIAGGIAQGFTSSLPAVATDLSTFMTNLEPFIAGAKSFDASAMDGVKALIGVMLAITGANVIEGLTSWFTGGSSIVKFGEDIAAFAPNFKLYADTVSGIDYSVVEASANAAKALAEMTSYIPNSGGMASWFTGDNSIAQFGKEIVTLGEGLKNFADSMAGTNPESLTAAADAAKALAEMTTYIPNTGGVAAWFAGESSISKFGTEIVLLGAGLRGFSDAIVGINPESLIAASNAAKSLVEMTTYIPNSGGLAAWFTGDNSVAKFSEDLVALGEGLNGFATAIVGINPETIVAAANAAKSLAEMTTYIPNTGGVASWFAGENSVSAFSADLVVLGGGLKGFSDAVLGINPETMLAAANAAKTLAEMTSYIPNTGGVVSWFAGDSSVSKFSEDLVSLGEGLNGFSVAVAGINTESVLAASNAARSLAEMTTYIPSEGGIKSWFTGENSVSKFSSDLIPLGEGLKGFSDAVVGINVEAISAAANAAKALAEMASHVPNEGGMQSWFNGSSGVASFAETMPALGGAIKGFSESVAGINLTNVRIGATAATTLAEMTAGVPEKSGKLTEFGKHLSQFGESLSAYYKSTSIITAGAGFTTTKFVDAIKPITTLNYSNIKSTAKAIDALTESVDKLSDIPKNSVSDFSRNMKQLGEKGVDSFLKALQKLESDAKKAAQEAIESFSNGIKSKISDAKSKWKDLATKCAEAIENKLPTFKQIGRDLVTGFADGISANSYKAEAKAKAMATAAANAAKRALDINSPSKVFRKIGMSVPEGFAMGIEKLGGAVTESSNSMARSAIESAKNSISRIAALINSDIDAQPTIRPVLDLSDVESRASAIGGMLETGSSIGVSAHIGAISTMMNQRNRSGDNSELISAIDSLRKGLGNTTYNINGVTYDDGSNISDAVKTIVRAAKVERRI